MKYVPFSKYAFTHAQCWKTLLSFFSLCIRFRFRETAGHSGTFCNISVRESCTKTLKNAVFSPSGVSPSCVLWFSNELSSSSQFFLLYAELSALWEELNYKVQLTLSFSLVKILSTVFAELTMDSNRAPKLVRGSSHDISGSQLTFSLRVFFLVHREWNLFRQGLGLLNL